MFHSCDGDDVVGGGSPIGSAHKKLTELLPSTNLGDTVSMMKDQVIQQLAKSGKLKDAIRVQVNEVTGEEETIIDQDMVMQAINESYGDAGTVSKIKMTSKPRKKDKGGQRAGGDETT